MRQLFSFIFMPQNSGVLGLHNSVVGRWLLNPQGLSPCLNYPFCSDSGHFERDTQAGKSGGILCFLRYVAEAQPCALLMSRFFLSQG